MKAELSYQELLKTSPYKPVKAKIVKTNKYTEFEKLFRIELDGKKDLEHVPGQFVQVSLFGVGEAPISVCSSPTEKGYFELTVRRVGGLTTAMHKLETGSVLGSAGRSARGYSDACGAMPS
jgi:NAD(P)H-flavin reductase